MALRMTDKAGLLLAGFITLFNTYSYARNIPENEYRSYKVGYGIEFQATERVNFVNILRDGKLLWRQFVGYGGDARFRPHEERRFTFDDINHNGVPDFFYIFENEVGSADMMRPDPFWERPVEKREPEDFPFPIVGVNPNHYSFFLCLDWGNRCILVRYQKLGRCYRDDGRSFDANLCDTFRGEEREAVSIETSSTVSGDEWRTILAYFGKFMGEEAVADFRYALSKDHTSTIKTPEFFKPLEPWSTKIKVKSGRVALYRDTYGNRKLGSYLLAGDEAEVLDRHPGSVIAKYDAKFIVGYKVDPVAEKSNRLLIRYRGKRSITIGWIDIADTVPVEPTPQVGADRKAGPF